MVGAAGDHLIRDMRIVRHAAEDRRQWFGGGNDQRTLVAGEHRPQCFIDGARIARHDGMFARRLAAPHVSGSRKMAAPADGGIGVARHARHLAFVRRQIGRYFNEPRGAHANRQNVGVMRKGHCANKRLQQEAIRYFRDVGQLVGQPERLNSFGRHEDRETVSLIGPEIVVFDQRVDARLHRPDRPLVDARFGHLGNGGFEEVLEFDLVGLGVLRQRRGAEVEGDRRRTAIGRKFFNFRTARKVDVKQG